MVAKRGSLSADQGRLLLADPAGEDLLGGHGALRPPPSEEADRPVEEDGGAVLEAREGAAVTQAG
jgi:hypothetical protein